MKTIHTTHFGKSQNLNKIKDNSVDLIVTSPPYPMIEMWDGIMAGQNPKIQDAFDSNKCSSFF